MRAPTLLLALCAITFLASPVRSDEVPSSLFDNLYGLMNDFLSMTPSNEVFCSTLLGTNDLINKSGGVLPDQYAKKMVDVFNAHSFYRCRVVEVEEEPTLRFLQSYKAADGTMWNIFYTYSFGPISYTWRIATIPYA